MPQPAASRKRALLVAPEPPALGRGGGPMRTQSLLEYLQRSYDVDVVTFKLAEHSKALSARVMRNATRLLRGVPPLFDRYSGYEQQLPTGPYDLAVVEHFWCASYAPALRTRAKRLVLDLHNIESELARTHAASLSGSLTQPHWMHERFAAMYENLERKWLPRFDTLLVTSEVDRARLSHPDIRVFPNAIPLVPVPNVPQNNAMIFSGNLEYHPNVEAVRWFATHVHPNLATFLEIGEWRLVGRNSHAIEPVVRNLPRTAVIGAVDDAIRTIAEGMLCIVPLQSGSGTRFKILEAWAARKPVVSTTIGAEGLGAVNEEHLLLADSSEEFTQAILRIYREPKLREHLAATGRKLYEDRFTWDAAWRQLDETSGL